MIKGTSATVIGLTATDYRCPICMAHAAQKLTKGDWIICRTHGAIEGLIKVPLALSLRAA